VESVNKAGKLHRNYGRSKNRRETIPASRGDEKGWPSCSSFQGTQGVPCAHPRRYYTSPKAKQK